MTIERLALALAILIVAGTAQTACSRIRSEKQPLVSDSNREQSSGNVDRPPSNLQERDGHVTDRVGIFDLDSRKRFEDVLTELQTKARIDFALAVIKSTNGEKISDYSMALAKDWKVGSTNGGILQVVAIDDRAWHIQIDKKLEQHLTSGDVKAFGDSMVPYLKDGKYIEGIEKCVENTIARLAELQNFDPIKF